jgi:hypothetical protein
MAESIQRLVMVQSGHRVHLSIPIIVTRTGTFRVESTRGLAVNSRRVMRSDRQREDGDYRPAQSPSLMRS